MTKPIKISGRRPAGGVKPRAKTAKQIIAAYEARKRKLVQLYDASQKRLLKGEGLQAIADSLGLSYSALVTARSRARGIMREEEEC